MSVLLKRTPWMLSAAMAGILTLGLAGCGGDDDAVPGPIPNLDVFAIPNNVQLTPRQAQGQQSIPGGQGGQVTVANLNPANFGGVEGVLVTFPTGTSGQNETFGVAVVPANEQTIAHVRNVAPNTLGGEIRFIETIAELLIGPVNPDGTVNTENVPDTPLTYQIQLTEAQANFLQSQLGGNNRHFRVFRVQNGVASVDRECEIQFVRENRNVTVTKCRGGRAIVTHRPRGHEQGGGGS